MFAELMEEYFNILRLNYKQQDYYRSMAYDWLFEGCFSKLHVMIQSMYNWIEKFYNLSTLSVSKIEMENINSTLQEFNKAVIKEIEKHRVQMEKESGEKINFNKAAMKWIDSEYKKFKKNWFEKNCNISCEKVFKLKNS